MADNLTDISSLTINDTLFDVATTTMPLDLASSTFTITNLDLTIMNNLTTEMVKNFKFMVIFPKILIKNVFLHPI